MDIDIAQQRLICPYCKGDIKQGALVVGTRHLWCAQQEEWIGKSESEIRELVRKEQEDATN